MDEFVGSGFWLVKSTSSEELDTVGCASEEERSPANTSVVGSLGRSVFLLSRKGEGIGTSGLETLRVGFAISELMEQIEEVGEGNGEFSNERMEEVGENMELTDDRMLEGPRIAGLWLLWWAAAWMMLVSAEKVAYSIYDSACL